MQHNSVIDTLLAHKSIRRYTDEMPSDEILETVVRAGQQAPFASQLYSVILSRKKSVWDAPLSFLICVDAHKLELFMARRGWQIVTNDLSLLLLGIQDASLMAQNMIVAGESLGLGSCLIGVTGLPSVIRNVLKDYDLPPRVLPLVLLVMGYPDEDPPPRPRYPFEFAFFEDAYPDLDEQTVQRAMDEMDEGYLAQDYYRDRKAKIALQGERPETFGYDDYSWTEHISRKWGQWFASPDEVIEQLAQCGFDVTGSSAPNTSPDLEPLEDS
jgi:nitroreductase